MIVFNRPPLTGNESQYVLKAMQGDKISGDGPFGQQCRTWFEAQLGCHRALLTPSCTAALEMAALLADIGPGDEVIMPSYTFVSTANAFALRGATIVFVDIRPDTLNLDERQVERAITSKTRALVPVHYAGVGCDMSSLMALAQAHGLYVIEDAAQGIMSTYRDRPLGSFGHLAAFSFHETKNITSGGEGGLLAVNDAKLIERAEIIREKGTNRSQFFRGEVDKYTWVDVGSSYLPGELQAAYLWGQLEQIDAITADRLATWRAYRKGLADLEGLVLPVVPPDCTHNGHMFHIRLRDLEARSAMLEHLRACGVMGVFHYVPLHSSPAGQRLGRFSGEDVHTTAQSERLIRLPLWFGMSDEEVGRVIAGVRAFFD